MYEELEMRMSLRLGWLVLPIAIAVGCDGGGEGSTEGGGGSAGTLGAAAGAGGSAGAGEPPVAPPEPPDSGAGGAPAETAGTGALDAGGPLDAGMADAAPPSTGPRCDDDEMPCGEDCIPSIEPTLDDLQKRIFSGSCGLSSSCHMGVSPKEGLDLSSTTATLEYVDEASAQMPSAKIIDTDSPEDSYLLRKLRGMDIAEKASTGRASTQMPPPPSMPLCEEKLEVIEAWIRAGAEP
jgi:hypothetical protein